jgi:hypothetical protein
MPVTLLSRLLLAVMLFTALALPGSAPATGADEQLAPERTKWRVTAMFEKDAKKDELRDQPRMNLSGAACAPTTPPFSVCLMVNDEKKYAQFFSIEGRKISPKKKELIRLSDADKDPDGEGAAYADGFFYVAGSHGRKRHNPDNLNDTSYAVFRFPVDPATGTPPFEVSEDDVVGVEATSRLRDAIRTGDGIKDFYDRPLAQGGVNIEGIAVKRGRMHLGLRGPSRDGKAFILSVDAAAAFSKDADLKAKVSELALGTDTGIRDLAAVGDGILVLAGPTRDEPVPYSVWQWNEGGAPRRLATLDLKRVTEGAKAEILLLLAEKPKSYRVLVIFDGIENGGPLSFKLPR